MLTAERQAELICREYNILDAIHQLSVEEIMQPLEYKYTVHNNKGGYDDYETLSYSSVLSLVRSWNCEYAINAITWKFCARQNQLVQEDVSLPNEKTPLNLAIENGECDLAIAIIEKLNINTLDEVKKAKAIEMLYSALMLAIGTRDSDAQYFFYSSWLKMTTCIIDKIVQDKTVTSAVREKLLKQPNLLEKVIKNCDTTIVERIIGILGHDTAIIMAEQNLTLLCLAVELYDVKRVQIVIDLLRSKNQIARAVVLGIGENHDETPLYLALTKQYSKSSSSRFAIPIIDALNIEQLDEPLKTQVINELYLALKLAIRRGLSDVVECIMKKISADDVNQKVAADQSLTVSPLTEAFQNHSCETTALITIIDALGTAAASIIQPPLAVSSSINPVLHWAVNNNKELTKTIIAALGIDAEKQIHDYTHFNNRFVNLCILEYIKENLFPKLIKGETLAEQQKALCAKHVDLLIQALQKECEKNPAGAVSLLTSAFDPKTKLGEFLCNQPALITVFNSSIAYEARKDFIKKTLLEKGEIPTEQKGLCIGDAYKEAQKEIARITIENELFPKLLNDEDITEEQQILCRKYPEILKEALFKQCNKNLSTPGLRFDFGALTQNANLEMLTRATDPTTKLGEILSTQISIVDEIWKKIDQLIKRVNTGYKEAAEMRKSVESSLVY